LFYTILFAYKALWINFEFKIMFWINDCSCFYKRNYVKKRFT